MKRKKDYTLVALFIPFLIAVISSFPGCYSTSSKANITRIDGLVKTKYVCPDCGEWGCIYETIDEAYDENSDTSILKAILEVCKEKNITDPETIDLLKANYNLSK